MSALPPPTRQRKGWVPVPEPEPEPEPEPASIASVPELELPKPDPSPDPESHSELNVLSVPGPLLSVVSATQCLLCLTRNIIVQC